MSTAPYRVLSTFDPFITFEQKLPRVRVAERPVPTASQTLVLVGGPEMVEVRSGQRVPNWLFAGYRYLYVVDVGEHPLELTCALPAADGAFVFHAHLAYTVFVADAMQVVRSHVRNAAAALAPLLIGRMRECTQTFDAGDVGPAERKINAVLARVEGDSGLAVRRCLAQLTIDTDEGRGFGSIGGPRWS